MSGLDEGHAGAHAIPAGLGPGNNELVVRMTFEHGAALSRLIVRYLSLPEAPLVPPAEEQLVLDVYEAVLDVMVPWAMTRSEFDGQAELPRPVKGAEGEAR